MTGNPLLKVAWEWVAGYEDGCVVRAWRRYAASSVLSQVQSHGTE